MRLDRTYGRRRSVHQRGSFGSSASSSARYSRIHTKASGLAGNHFATVREGLEHLPAIGERVLWQGAQPIRFVEA